MRKEFELKLVGKRDEALNAVTLSFEVPSSLTEDFSFEAGQFVGITADINGEEVHRSYSICSSPMEKESFEISVKKIEGGKMSTYLVDHLQAGQSLKVTPPAGHFFKNFENKKHHIMFAAGSGVTPMISIIHYLTSQKPEDKISLFYWNQSLKSTMFLKEVQDWFAEQKLNLFMGLTKESKEQDDTFCFFERLNSKTMKDCFYKWSTNLDMPVFYMCGPEDFMNTVESFLGNKGYDSSQIRKESFFPQASKVSDVSLEDQGPLLIGDKSTLSETLEACIGVFDGETVQVEPEKEETVLESFLRAGESPPYSCLEGTCIACQCKVIEGVVEMPLDSFLSEDEIAEGLVLSCQAKQKSKTLKVDFDDL